MAYTTIAALAIIRVHSRFNRMDTAKVRFQIHFVILNEVKNPAR
jgi:hypothetical protein